MRLTLRSETREAMIETVVDSHLLSVSASRGPVFPRYPFNGQIDQGETWAQEALECDQIFHIILLSQKSQFHGLAIGV